MLDIFTKVIEHRAIYITLFNEKDSRKERYLDYMRYTKEWIKYAFKKDVDLENDYIVKILINFIQPSWVQSSPYKDCTNQMMRNYFYVELVKTLTEFDSKYSAAYTEKFTKLSIIEQKFDNDNLNISYVDSEVSHIYPDYYIENDYKAGDIVSLHVNRDYKIGHTLFFRNTVCEVISIGQSTSNTFSFGVNVCVLNTINDLDLSQLTVWRQSLWSSKRSDEFVLSPLFKKIVFKEFLNAIYFSHNDSIDINRRNFIANKIAANGKNLKMLDGRAISIFYSLQEYCIEGKNENDIGKYYRVIFSRLHKIVFNDYDSIELESKKFFQELQNDLNDIFYKELINGKFNRSNERSLLKAIILIISYNFKRQDYNQDEFFGRTINVCYKLLNKNFKISDLYKIVRFLIKIENDDNSLRILENLTFFNEDTIINIINYDKKIKNIHKHFTFKCIELITNKKRSNISYPNEFKESNSQLFKIKKSWRFNLLMICSALLMIFYSYDVLFKFIFKIKIRCNQIIENFFKILTLLQSLNQTTNGIIVYFTMFIPVIISSRSYSLTYKEIFIKFVLLIIFHTLCPVWYYFLYKKFLSPLLVNKIFDNTVVIFNDIQKTIHGLYRINQYMYFIPSSIAIMVLNSILYRILRDDDYIESFSILSSLVVIIFVCLPCINLLYLIHHNPLEFLYHTSMLTICFCTTLLFWEGILIIKEPNEIFCYNAMIDTEVKEQLV